MKRNDDEKARKQNPYTKASPLSKLFYWWLKPMFTVGLKRSIEEDDIYAVTNEMRCESGTEAFAKLWDLELGKSKPSLFRVIFKIHSFELLTYGLAYGLCETLAKLLQPICLGGLVTYFAQTEGQTVMLRDAYWYAAGIVASTALLLAVHPFMLYATKSCCNIRVACGGLIYRKLLRIPKSSAKDGGPGQIINLLSNDITKFDHMFFFIHELWKSPLQMILAFVVIYMQIGFAGAIGLAFLLAFIPLQGWIGKKSGQLRMKIAKRTDFRIKIMHEIIQGIQVIKMYAWETSFAEMVYRIRNKEMAAIRSDTNILATLFSFSIISKVSIFLSLVSYVLFGNVITAKKVFIVSAYFSSFDRSMLFLFPLALSINSEAYTSVKRLQEFLLTPESKKKGRSSEHDKSDLNDATELTALNHSQKNGSDGVRVHNIVSEKPVVRFENVTGAWGVDGVQQTNGLFDLNMEIESGLCTIIGEVGSCKSTLLNAILGELEIDNGSITINGSISYASQEPWLFEGSVRKNIVFVESFDEQRYNQVVKVCALEPDFKLLPQGDATVVGEQGSSLSGGQKARVNLARAVYKQSDIYLLDDPLSAVDAHVGKHIFQQCVEGFLQDKICILVTHQLQYLKNVQRVILMRNGKIESDAPFQQLNKESLTNVQTEDDEPDDSGQNQSPQATVLQEDEIREAVPNDRMEQRESGSVKFATYKSFFKAVHSNVFIVAVLVVFIAGQAAKTGCDYLLSQWINWEESVAMVNGTSTSFTPSTGQSHSIVEKREFYITIYSCIVAAGVVTSLSRSFSLYRMCMRISINLHDMMFRGITRAKMLFFNNNSSGRIINRFARDIGNVDSLLPKAFYEVSDAFVQYVAVLVISAIVNPWLLVPSAVMTGFFVLMRFVFIQTGRGFKRIEALSRSPIFSHVNATLQGLSTVRVCNASEILQNEFHMLQDYNTSCWFLFNSASLWYSIWLDITCLLYITCVTCSFLAFSDGMDSGQVGLAIMSSMNLIGFAQWGMRQSGELENQMTSVERIVEYANLQPEPPLESDKKNAPPKNWPQSGDIIFQTLSMRYSENSRRILQEISFRIAAKEKVGIVGRTGAGKSSIIQSIFRLAKNEGHIFIDDIDVEQIGLHDLRKNISIIPQEAIMFSGSLRFNLDPFSERSDTELWAALDQVELKTVVQSLPGGLDGKVLDGGSNFSAGQRQLICLARAILRNNKILILDEATANVDSKTDELIQQTIRSHFADCTVITIAHRLNTVVDSDKVLVVDAGRAVEFDHPFDLIRKEDGFFKRLLDQTGGSNATALTLIAEESYKRREAKLLSSAA